MAGRGLGRPAQSHSVADKNGRARKHIALTYPRRDSHVFRSGAKPSHVHSRPCREQGSDRQGADGFKRRPKQSMIFGPGRERAEGYKYHRAPVIDCPSWNDRLHVKLSLAVRTDALPHQMPVCCRRARRKRCEGRLRAQGGPFVRVESSLPTDNVKRCGGEGYHLGLVLRVAELTRAVGMPASVAATVEPNSIDFPHDQVGLPSLDNGTHAGQGHPSVEVRKNLADCSFANLLGRQVGEKPEISASRLSPG